MGCRCCGFGVTMVCLGGLVWCFNGVSKVVVVVVVFGVSRWLSLVFGGPSVFLAVWCFKRDNNF